MQAHRKCAERVAIQPGVLGSVLVVGLLALAGCGSTRGATHPLDSLLTPVVTEAASKQGCSDAASCRDTLRGLRSVTPASACELRERVEVARRACVLGVAEGCTELGRAELWGVRVEDGPDLYSARSLFQRACEQGDGEGCARHALTTLLGEGVPRDEAAGMAGLQASCDKYPGAACGVGALGLNEDARRRGVAPEREWIALFAQRGCEAGDALSCRLLGDAFHEGDGVSRDIGKALELYQRACEAGNGMACANGGMISLQSGEATEATRADDLFSRGCELGSSEACRMLVLQSRDPRGAVKDEAARQALFRHACDRGAAMGCLALYDALRQKPPEPGMPLELSGLLKRACRYGETQACGFLEEVSRVTQRQCAAGTASACGVLGALLLSQPTVGSEAAEGMQLLHRACEGGDAMSCTLMRDVSLGLTGRSGLTRVFKTDPGPAYGVCLELRGGGAER
jgi:TPR repeat protein